MRPRESGKAQRGAASFCSVAIGTVAALLWLLACSQHVGLAPPAAPLTPPTRPCGENEGPPACRSADELEQLLAGRLEILGVADTPSGMQGAKILTLRAHGRSGESVLRAKWRAQSSGGLINEPRKELAAYAVQKLFLDASERVVPATVAHCFPTAEYRRFDREAESFLPGVDCVLGFLSYWLEDARTVDGARRAGWLGPGSGVWDRQRFERDDGYRESVSNSNLLTYLIDHGDAHEEQFVLQATPHGLRAFVVDNSIAFRSIKNPLLVVRQDWSELQVPALSPKSIARLRALALDEFARLGNVAELALENGTLVHTSPARRMPSDGTTMTWDGKRLRIGLTRGEIQLVAARTRDLLSRRDLDQLTRP